ncbi:MAG: hydrogenase maturation protease [Candidatus Krumholzibacteria bacterium]|nr:hydrogenase maturation protease [Candidatus Krumholzibacteria bacterium]
MKTLVLGLGNTVLRDDGVGVYAARILKGRVSGSADVVEAELAGFNLLEMMNGYDRVFVIDSIQLEGEDPGTVFRIRPDDLRITPRLASFHDIDIVTALELGRRLDLKMPDEVVIYAVQVEDMVTLEEGCLPSVERVIPALVAEIESEVKGQTPRRVSKRLSERRNRKGA